MVWITFCVLLLLLFLLIGWYSYRTAFYSPANRKEDHYALPKGEQYEKERQRMLSLIREMAEIPYEAVSISAYDGTKLAARYYHVRDSAPLQIQFHGYRGTALRDFCGGNKLAREAGQNTLVVDQRAHGKSGGTTITFGIRERWDCLSWVEYANKRFGSDTPILLCGVSMGAATVLMASELDLPDNVIGIIADCPYSSPEAIIRKVCREDMHLPPALTMPFVRWGAGWFGHFDLREASAVKVVQHTDIPILLKSFSSSSAGTLLCGKAGFSWRTFAAAAVLFTKTDSAACSAQEKLNAVWKSVLTGEVFNTARSR